MYTTYVLYSPFFNKIYIGVTSDIDKRLTAHNHPKNKGWTRKFRPWVLLHSEHFNNKQEALIREKQLKTARGRAFIWDLVNQKLG